MTASVLVITDHLDAGPELVAALRSRAERGSCAFRLLATNPARAEFHLLHADRHDAVARSQPALRSLLEQLEAEVGAPFSGEVSIRHDAFEAAEEELLARPADELVVSVHEHALAHRLHHDLPARLEHLHLPVTVVPVQPATARA